MDELDKKIKSYLERELSAYSTGARRAMPPSTEEFYLFLTDRLEGEGLNLFLEFLKREPEAHRMVMEARKLMNSPDGDAEKVNVPEALLQKAKDLVPQYSNARCPHCGKSITPFKKPIARKNLYDSLWLVASIAAFMMSFYYRHYFYQCLALALFFGVKWSLDRRATKMQILIYKVLKEEQSPNDRRQLSRAIDQ